MSILASRCQKECCQVPRQENWFGNKLIGPEDWHASPILLGTTSSARLKSPLQPLQYCATLPICWILQDRSVPLFRTPLRFQASIFHVYVSLKGQLVSFQNPLQPKQEDPDVRQSAPARPSTVVHTLTGEKGNSWSFGFRTGKR